MLSINLFTDSVDSNKTLSDARRLQYLKTFVKEEHYRLISSLTITNTNYRVALNSLRKRYRNKNVMVLVREHIHSTVSFNAIICENPTFLRNVIKTTYKNVSFSQNRVVDDNSWDPILTYLTTERLDAVTRKDWKQHASANSTNQRRSILLRFANVR